MTIGSPKEDDFAAGLERAGTSALEWAQSYMTKMEAMLGRELGSTKADPQEELMDYIRFRDDPQMLHQGFLIPLMQQHGKGRGRELFLKWVQDMEKKIASS